MPANAPVGALVGFLFTTDYERAKAFYVEKLGFEFVSLDQWALVMRWGSNMIRITKLPDFTPNRATVLGWEVADIEASIAWLKSRGVQPERFPWMQDAEFWTAPGGDKIAWFKDADGNILSFSQHA